MRAGKPGPEGESAESVPAIKRTDTGFIVTVPDGDSISHEGLGSMPFKSTIEDWVRQYFPDAVYRESKEPAIEPPDLLHTKGLIVLQAPKGAGKSKAIRAAVEALTPKNPLTPPTSVVQVTFRRTLAWSSNEMMGAGASLYSDIAANTINARHHPRLTIVVNSVGRITGFYDVVVIDEVVSVLDMLSGPLLPADVKVEAVATLTGLLAHARCVVIADAMLDAACVDFVRKCRAGGRLEAASSKGGGGAEEEAFHVVDYTSRIHNDYVYVAHATCATWLRDLSKALAVGKRVVVPCMTKTMAKRVADMFVKRYRVQCYTGDTDPALLAQHMLDIHAHWGGDVQLLIYSPVVTAGCSFERKHFDVVFFYGFAGLGSVRSAAQMIARVRDVADKRVHVYVEKAVSYLPLNSRPMPLATRVATTPKKFYMQLLELLERYRAQEDVQAAHAFPFYFWSLVVHSGARIGYVREDLQPFVPPALQTLLTEGEATDLDDVDLWTELNGQRPDAGMFHDWDADVPRVLPLCTRPLQQSASFLQRVHQVHPRHWQGVGLTPPMFIVGMKPEEVEPGAPTLNLHTRVWLALIAQKAFRRVIMDARPNPRTPLPRTGPPSVTTARFFPPRVALTYTNPARVNVLFPDAGVRAAIKGAAGKFSSTCTGSFFDASADAWVLAAAETAMMTATPLSAQVLKELTLPTDLSVLGVKVVEVMNGILLRMPLVIVNYPIITSKAQALLDYLCMDREGNWHIVLCRACGGVDSHMAEDYTKACALAALAGVDVHTVTILYIAEQFRVVTLELPCGGLRHIEQSVPAATLTALDDYMGDVEKEGDATEGKEEEVVTADAVRAWEATRRTALLAALVDTCAVPAWDCKNDPDVNWDNVAEWLATAVARFLGINKSDVDLGDARILGSVNPDESLEEVSTECMLCDEADAKPVDPDPHGHVKMLYEGVLTRGFLVYYWNARPWGIPIRNLV
jgi:hypothetical protein